MDAQRPNIAIGFHSGNCLPDLRTAEKLAKDKTLAHICSRQDEMPETMDRNRSGRP